MKIWNVIAIALMIVSAAHAQLPGGVHLGDHGTRIIAEPPASATGNHGKFDVGGKGRGVRWRKFVISSPPESGEHSTGWALPAHALVTDVLVKTTTAETSPYLASISVGLLSSGTGGDADCFLAGVPISSAILTSGNVSITTGTTETYVTGATYGVSLTQVAAGSDSDGDTGIAIRKPYATDTHAGRTVSYSVPRTMATWKGEIYVVYTEVED